jgi:catechol 2,3-dioxygenase-like lactoylglutathione lyase family enzyme
MIGVGATQEGSMHRSRLTAVIIDLSSEAFEAGAEFWSAALGRERVVKNERYEALKGRLGGVGGPFIGLQRGMDDAQRLHLDVETDDVDAEVSRLEALGARVKQRIRNHVVMRAPGGHTFCVIPVARSDFEESAATWS